MRSAFVSSALCLIVSACAGNPGAIAAAPVTGDAAAIAAIAAMPDSAFARADSFLVRFETSKGPFDLMVRRHWAPNGAVRVGEAVRANYYDGARFFRALRGFVIQWGLAADSANTAKWRGRSIPDDTVRVSNRRMTVSFAAGTAKNTRTVQLFINLRDNARLDAMGFSPIGEIVSGIDVVNAIYTADHQRGRSLPRARLPAARSHRLGARRAGLAGAAVATPRLGA
jgi:peptidyl-prolyl cis-trans isomerase A (cyclophilin A)